MNIDYLLFIIFIIFLFYNFDFRCKEGIRMDRRAPAPPASPAPPPPTIFSPCENKLKQLCDNSRNDSLQKCTECLTNNSTAFDEAKCESENYNNFCKIKFSPEDDDIDALMTRLNSSLDINSVGNGIFVSMIFHNGDDMLYMDGSGSILFPSLYEKIFISEGCNFGFLWDTDFLNKNLISCLFPVDAHTTPINSKNSQLDCIAELSVPRPTSTPAENKINVCSLAGVSSPDRCTKGLKTYFEHKGILELYASGNDEIPYPVNCQQQPNIKYQFTEPYVSVPLNEGTNCFRYIVDKFNTNKKSPDIFLLLSYPYNEGVFLKNVDNDGIEIHEGLKQLTILNKPKPVALFYAIKNNESIGECFDYESKLNLFKLNFTSDTPVIIMKFNEYLNHIIEISYILLQDMPQNAEML